MSQSNLSVTTLKKHLKDCPKEVLIDDIAELFKRFPAVKDYYQLKLSPGDDSQVLDKYKKVIEKEFFPARGIGKASLSTARKAVTEYKKVCTNPIGLADLMLFYVEQGEDTSGIGWGFYDTLSEIYEEAFQA
ncbi:MAG TPA: DUF6155 family protein [Allocoleopsis sp.]